MGDSQNIVGLRDARARQRRLLRAAACPSPSLRSSGAGTWRRRRRTHLHPARGIAGRRCNGLPGKAHRQPRPPPHPASCSATLAGLRPDPAQPGRAFTARAGAAALWIQAVRVGRGTRAAPPRRGTEGGRRAGRSPQGAGAACRRRAGPRARPVLLGRLGRGRDIRPCSRACHGPCGSGRAPCYQRSSVRSITSLVAASSPLPRRRTLSSPRTVPSATFQRAPTRWLRPPSSAHERPV